MDIATLEKSLKKKTLASAYLISGEEDALVDRALERVTAAVLAESRGDNDFALTRLEGKGAAAGDVEAAARTASLFGGRRLVVLRDAQSLAAEQQKRLAEFLAKPVATATLVLVVRGAGPGTRDPRAAKAAKAAKLFQKAVEKGGGVSVDCPRPKARDLPRLAEGLLQEEGLRADRDGLYALVEAVGEDLGAMMQAVTKLAIFKGGSGTVGAADVAELVADTHNQSVFDLTDAVVGGDQRQALLGLRRLIRDGESPLAIVAHLVRAFRNLASVQALSRRGQSADEIRAALGMHPFVVKKSLQQCQRMAPGALASRLRLLANADRSLKGGRLPDELVLERLVGSLCAGESARVG